MQDSSEKRRHSRLQIAVPMRLYIQGVAAALDVLLLDLSRGGCFLATPLEVAVGAAATITFVMLPDRACSTRGAVVRVQGTVGFGVQFEEANAEFARFLEDLEAELPERRHETVEKVLAPAVRVAW